MQQTNWWQKLLGIQTGKKKNQIKGLEDEIDWLTKDRNTLRNQLISLQCIADLCLYEGAYTEREVVCAVLGILETDPEERMEEAHG